MVAGDRSGRAAGCGSERRDAWVAAHSTNRDAVTAGDGPARRVPSRPRLPHPPTRSHPHRCATPAWTPASPTTPTGAHPDGLWGPAPRPVPARWTGRRPPRSCETTAFAPGTSPTSIGASSALATSSPSPRCQHKVGTAENTATQRLRGMIDAGETGRARRVALAPEQTATEAEIRRDFGIPLPEARVEPARDAGVGGLYQAHLGAQRDHEQGQDLVRRAWTTACATRGGGSLGQLGRHNNSWLGGHAHRNIYGLMSDMRTPLVIRVVVMTCTVLLVSSGCQSDASPTAAAPADPAAAMDSASNPADQLSRAVSKTRGAPTLKVQQVTQSASNSSEMVLQLQNNPKTIYVSQSSPSGKAPDSSTEIEILIENGRTLIHSPSINNSFKDTFPQLNPGSWITGPSGQQDSFTSGVATNPASILSLYGNSFSSVSSTTMTLPDGTGGMEFRAQVDYVKLLAELRDISPPGFFTADITADQLRTLGFPGNILYLASADGYIVKGMYETTSSLGSGSVVNTYMANAPLSIPTPTDIQVLTR